MCPFRISVSRVFPLFVTVNLVLADVRQNSPLGCGTKLTALVDLMGFIPRHVANRHMLCERGVIGQRARLLIG